MVGTGMETLVSTAGGGVVVPGAEVDGLQQKNSKEAKDTKRMYIANKV
jgi:hypothetical protein